MLSTNALLAVFWLYRAHKYPINNSLNACALRISSVIFFLPMVVTNHIFNFIIVYDTISMVEYRGE